jgi:lipopolysaccharide biosynthesis glycosyltransferase
MRKLIYQVAVGKQSKLYEHCIESASKYAESIGADHIVQRKPTLQIRPDIFATERKGKTGGWEKMGYLPIFEKENAFDLFDDYDQIMILDSDIYIRPDSPDIFDEMNCKCAFGAVPEREMDLDNWYQDKIRNYSRMQYEWLHKKGIDFKPNNLGYEFFNMGMIVINVEYFKPFLKGQNARQFLNRTEFKDFIDGVGPWKWSTDQTLLNYFIKKYKVPTKKLDNAWNGLFTAVNNIEHCNFIHFFLKDKLPNDGEDVQSLMRQI